MNPHAQRDKARIDEIMTAIKANLAVPGYKPLTSLEMREQADRRRSMATGAKLRGKRVKRGYR